MNLRILRRRAEMLDAVCTGIHHSAVISQLAEKYDVSEKALWSDWLLVASNVQAVDKKESDMKVECKRP